MGKGGQMSMVVPAAAVVCAGVWLTGCAHGGEHGHGAIETAKEVVPKATAAVATAEQSAKYQAQDARYAKDGFYTELDENGRLWVFREGSEALATFKEHGEPAKVAIRPGAGPGGITVKSIDAGTIVEYLTTKPGFETSLGSDGRLWVFRAGSENLANHKQGIEPAKHVIRPGAGPMGLTLKAVDAEVLDAYLAAKDGFYTELDENGRLWVFREGSEALATFKEHGEPAKVAIRPGAGPGGITVKSIDAGTIVEYLTTKPGFETSLGSDGRLWVFRAGSENLANHKQGIEPAKHVIRPGAGPMGLTLKAVDAEVLDAYLAVK